MDVVFFTDGEGSRPRYTATDVAKRKQSAIKALSILGVKGTIEFLNYPDNELDRVSLLQLTQSLEEIILPLNPSIIYTHSTTDLNIDHQLVNRSVMTCFRPVITKKPSKIYGFEVPSSTEWALNDVFSPVHYVDISKQLNVKLKALNAYSSELRESPHPRSLEYIRALATVRGGQSGCNCAEGFEMLRSID